jgi:hypothetical protein
MNFKNTNSRFSSLLNDDHPKSNNNYKKHNRSPKKYNKSPKNYKKSPKNYNNNSKPVVQNIEINSNEFPSFLDNSKENNKIIVPINENLEPVIEEKTYLEKCRLRKEKDDKLRIKEGFLAIKMDKTTKKISYSRNGVDFVNKYDDLFTEEEKELEQRKKKEKLEREREIRLNNLEMRYERESQLHYELTGELDGYALAKIEMEKYEEYCRNLERQMEEENINEAIDQNYENEEYISD